MPCSLVEEYLPVRFRKSCCIHSLGSIFVPWTKRQQVPPIQIYLTTKPVFPNLFYSRTPFGYEKQPPTHTCLLT